MEKTSYLGKQVSQKMTVKEILDDHLICCFSGMKSVAVTGREPEIKGSCGCIKSLDPYYSVNRGVTGVVTKAEEFCFRVTGSTVSAVFPNFPSGITGQLYYGFLHRSGAGFYEQIPSFYNGLNSPGSQYKEKKAVDASVLVSNSGSVFMRLATEALANDSTPLLDITTTGLYCYDSSASYLPNFFTVFVAVDFEDIDSRPIGTGSYLYSGYFLGTPIDSSPPAASQIRPRSCSEYFSIDPGSIVIDNGGDSYIEPITITNNIDNICAKSRNEDLGTYHEIRPFQGEALIDEENGAITGVLTIDSGLFCLDKTLVISAKCDPPSSFKMLSFSFSGGFGANANATFALIRDTGLVGSSGNGGFYDSSGRFCVEVAKPHALRKTPFHGKSIDDVVYSYSALQTRTATHAIANHKCSSGQASTEKVNPAYKIGDVIFVSKNISDKTDLANAQGTALFFIDENRDARHWEDNCGGGAGGGAAVWL